MIAKDIKVENLLYETEKESVYKVYDDEKKVNLLAKLFKTEYPSKEDIIEIEREFKILQDLKSIYTPKDVKLDKYRNSYLFLSSYSGGISLKKYLSKRGPMSLDDFFYYSLKILDAIEFLHQNSILHRNLSTENIFIDENNKSISIIDFSIAAHFDNASNTLDFKRSKLEYISPELTDNVDRDIDYRSDYYSIGIIFYELLTKLYPFGDSSNLLEVVHAHTSKSADKIPLKFNIPHVLEQLIYILLEKKPENRYSSIYSLKKDMLRAKEAYDNYGYIEAFKLSNRINYGQFKIEGKLYGREKELKILNTKFNSILKGNKEVLLVNGYSGIGKTSLIEELEKEVNDIQGFFIEGKYDQFQKSIPYYAFSKAFSYLIKELLKKPKDELLNWSERIKYALGPNGQIIVDMIPELEAIIGKQEPLAKLGSEENQNRFNLTILNFIRVFAKKNHPLVMFIDDLQWTDTASLKLLNMLIKDYTFSYLFLVGAYRDNEVDFNHELYKEIKELEKEGYQIDQIKLENLLVNNIIELIDDSLQGLKNNISELAEIILKKTKGNPFYVKEFLKSIYHDKLLYYRNHKWQWQGEVISSKATGDNVVDLMVKRILSYDDSVQELIQLASIIGNQFKFDTLRRITNKPVIELIEPVKKLINEGLFKSNQSEVFFKQKKYLSEYKKLELKFLHDRVQQGAYKLIPEDKKVSVHYTIASMLYNKESIKDDELIFDIVEHYNKAKKLIDNQEELINIAELNLYCGDKASDSNAYKQSLVYYLAGLNLLAKSLCEEQETKFKLLKGQIRAMFLLGRSEEAINIASKTLLEFDSLEQAIEINTILILYYGGAGEMDKAIELAINLLKEFKIKIPREPNIINLTHAIIDSKLYLLNKSDKDLVELKRYESERVETIFMLLKELVAPSYLQGESNLLPFVLLKMFNFTLKYGSGPVTSFAYGGYGLLWAKLGFPNLAYKFGRIALEINPRVNYAPMQARCYFMTGSFSLYWHEDYVKIEKIRKNGFRALVDAGEYFWASYIYLFGFWQHIMISTSIDESLYLLKNQVDFAKKAQQVEPYYIHLLHYQMLEHLCGSENELFFLGQSEDEAKSYFDKNRSSTAGIFYHATLSLFMGYISGEYAKALESGGREEINMSVIKDGTFTRIIYSFLYVLNCLENFNSYDELVKSSYYSKYKLLKKDISKWYKLSKKNFEFFHLAILIAENRLKKDTKQDSDRYITLINLAKKLESPLFEAIANEVAGKYWLERDNEKLGTFFYNEAIYLYYRFGAHRKIKFLLDKYPSLKLKSEKLRKSTKEKKDASPGGLNLITLQKYAKVIKDGMDSTRLIEMLLSFLVENVGATRGAYIERDDRNFNVHSEYSENSYKIIDMPLNKWDKLPIGLIRYSIRSKKEVIVKDVENSKEYSNLYKENNIKSLLIMPVVFYNKITGILYLESNLVSHLFTEEKFQLIELLVIDTVIAEQNLKLNDKLVEYNDTLESEVNKRALALKDKNKILNEKNLELEKVSKLLELKGKKIEQSLNYAKKIQYSLLPSTSGIDSFTEDNFIIYLPKDIVSGDFYYYKESDKYWYFALGDCTGHGVPAGFLSIISINQLTHVIDDRLDLGKTLYNLDSNIKTLLNKGGSSKTDGLDLTLIRINKENYHLEFTGAKHTLYLYKNGMLNKFKGSKSSIGGRLKKKQEFLWNMIGSIKGASLYLYTDGLIDQNNNEEAKYGIDRFEAILEAYSGKDMTKLKTKLLESLEDHRGDESQRDDISVIGLKF